MSTARDVERQFDLARLAVLKARACWAEWVAPPPAFECALADDEYARRDKVDLAAGEAERKLREAIGVLRTEFAGDGTPGNPADDRPCG